MVREQLVRFRNFLRKLVDRLYFPKKKYCCICNKSIGIFFSYRGGKRAPLMVALDTIGSDVNNFGCPNCGCHDRERHLALYLTEMNLFDKFHNAAILHFAPERMLSELIGKKHPSKYIRGDLFPTSEDIEIINILAIQYAAETFDFIIANHVLEHVDDDLVALSELRRVLKAGGYAILQTPYSPKLTKTFSDPGIESDYARYHAYGQNDHVRLYGNDIIDRIESVGFKSRVVSHDEKLGNIDPRQFGVNEKEPFFLFERVDAGSASPG